MRDGTSETRSLPRAANPFPVATALTVSPPSLHVGTSGWAYPTWRPGFYPQNVPPRSFLPYYASRLTSVEVNYTFRTLPSSTQLEGWLASVPPGFRFSFKAPQRITHFARLRECEAAVEAFLLALKPAHAAGKLGPLLFQLPPNFAADRERLASFLRLPGLRSHYLPTFAFEFRHASWFVEPIFDILRNENAALCVAESEDLRTPDVWTATHRYYRLRCPGGYPASALQEMGSKFAALAQGGEVFVYFKHEDEPTGAFQRSFHAGARSIGERKRPCFRNPERCGSALVASVMSNAATDMPWAAAIPTFHPRRWLSNGHLQTIVGNLLARPATLPEPVVELVEVVPARDFQISTQLSCECHWQPSEVRRERPTAIIVHGLEGSSRSQYVVGNATKLWAAGCNVVRMNMRNCGGTDHLTSTLYHSGLSADLNAVLKHFLHTQQLECVALVGYSMGGNLVLKLAGELGEDAPPQLRCVVGVSPVVDLAPSADALHNPANRLYEWRFLRALLRRFRRKSLLFPRAFDPQRAAHIGSIRAFDEQITALYSGFLSADDYYFRAAAARVLHRIAVPALLLHACDDPFIRLLPETREKIASNPHLTMLETAHGGHCAFLAERTGSDDGYWAEQTALRFILAHAQAA